MISKATRPSIAVLAALLCATTASAQDDRGTPEQRVAFAPDAFSLCSSYIPDPVRVEHSLRQNKSGLSDACRLVLNKAPARWPAEANNRIGLHHRSPAEVLRKRGREAV
jgi:hypothetical protein